MLTKTLVKDPFVLPRLLAGLSTILVSPTTAENFTTLHSFNGSDGDNPSGNLILSGTTLYGTTRGGGSSGVGTVFKINTDGTQFTNLYNFTATSAPMITNGDGASPTAGLALSGNTLYGTAAGGGTSGYGTVFAINTDGTGFRNLHSFNELVYQVAGLVVSG